MLILIVQFKATSEPKFYLKVISLFVDYCLYLFIHLNSGWSQLLRLSLSTKFSYCSYSWWFTFTIWDVVLKLLFCSKKFIFLLYVFLLFIFSSANVLYFDNISLVHENGKFLVGTLCIQACNFDVTAFTIVLI